MAESERLRGRAMVAGVRTVAVVGCGRIGSVIAESCARAGFPTTIVGPGAAGVRRLADRTLAGLEAAASRGELDVQAHARAASLLWFAGDLEAVDGVDLVIACGEEPPQARGPLLAAVERSAGPEAILAATSAVALPLGAFARLLARPERLVGLRLSSPEPAVRDPRHPAPIGRICEVAPAPATHPEVLRRAVHFVEALGAGVIVAVPPGRGLAA